jgi:hypothetical protein
MFQTRCTVCPDQVGCRRQDLFEFEYTYNGMGSHFRNGLDQESGIHGYDYDYDFRLGIRGLGGIFMETQK